MISIMCSDSRLSTAALVFYTCVWIPFVQLKTALVSLLALVLPMPWSHLADESSCQCPVNVCLPVARFEDINASKSNCNNGSETEEEEEEVCSICLVEFDKDDVVSQLHRCKHVFHMNCIEKWLERDQFTCPLCRSFLFAKADPTSHAQCSGGGRSVTTPQPHSSSWLSF